MTRDARLEGTPRAEHFRTIGAGLAQMWVMFGVTKGLDADVVCEASGFRQSDIADRDRHIPWSWYDALRRNVIAALPGVDVGIELAAFTSLAPLGYLGVALEHCADSLEVLRLAIRFGRTMASEVEALGPRLVMERDTVSWVIPGREEDPPEATEAILLGSVKMLRQLTGIHLRPERVTFPDHREVLAPKLCAILGCPVEFGAPDARIVFRRDDLERPLPRADAAAVEGCAAHLDKLVTKLEVPFVSVVSSTVEVQLATRDLSIRQTARRLGMSTRSLQRKLLQHGATHQQLVDEVRRTAAIRAVRESTRSFDEIASAIGYDDVSSLNRAFKRWTGATPREYRANGGLQPPERSSVSVRQRPAS